MQDMDNDDLRLIERSMISDDASFMVGLFLATQQLPGKANIPYLFSCIDFYSLIVYETYSYYVKNDAALAVKLKHAYEDDIKQSRQRMKLYDDKKLGIEGIGKTLLDTITPAHQKEVSKTHRIRLPKWMWEDVSLYFIEGNPIALGSTHLASFNTGIDVVRMFDPTTAKEFGQELGRFLIATAKGITLVRLPKINVTTQDIRSEKLYAANKYGSSSKTVNAGLSIIDMSLNFAALCLPPSTRHTTLFKWKFLSVYHAISSLRMLYDSSHAGDVSTEMLVNIKRVLDTDFAQLLESKGANALRNTLTHYGIDTRLDTKPLNMKQRQFYGLIEASLPGWTYESLATQLDVHIQDEMLNMLQAWR